MTIRNDFPDFGLQASFVTFNPDTFTVTLSGSPITSFDLSNYQYGVIYVAVDSQSIDRNLEIRWMGTVGAESSILARAPFCIRPEGTVVIPFQALTPTIVIADVDSSVYPYDIDVGCTLYTNPPYQHGYPGGIFAVHHVDTIAMGDGVTINPLGCGPGKHVLSVGTVSGDWSATIRIWPTYQFPIDIPLVTNGNGPLVNQEIWLPATSWTIDISNNDTDTDFMTIVARTPNPS